MIAQLIQHFRISADYIANGGFQSMGLKRMEKFLAEYLIEEISLYNNELWR